MYVDEHCSCLVFVSRPVFISSYNSIREMTEQTKITETNYFDKQHEKMRFLCNLH